ncbi:hypothetical protein ADL22_21065 [Streptomyces sp. NRRL F-4489]|uniref:hypothetical protein n=1 Tax=Streptomyces sp. NRRL F-4489 TaxID=1609095 RepID=UPI0007475F82|nr:hypothetical protein [Streptomyces sp. NRRL F-4489]KUL37560.1 hypothetical protein ADL22_21065 [Streptomyces sp. NRRL F-4489]
MRKKLSAWQAAAASSLVTAVAVVVPLSISSASASAAPEDPIVVTGPVVGQNKESVATCPEGTRVAGGGYQFDRINKTNGGRNPNGAITTDAPKTDGTGWRINSFGQYNEVKAYALCTHG